MIKRIKSKLLSLFGNYHLNKISEDVNSIRNVNNNIAIHNFLSKHLFENKKYKDSKRITQYLHTIYSQNGEDGLIDEIFSRIKSKNNFFIEFGVHGFKNNTTFLALTGWQGIWIEGDKEKYENLNNKVKDEFKANIQVLHHFLSPENIESILGKYEIPIEFDFISIDVDGMDFYIWQALNKYKPRVVMIEYNATLGDKKSLVIPQKKDYMWDATSYFGSSLKALEKLGNEKGYALVGCDFSGTNAFFVRKDLVKDFFESPFTSENHYEPPRYFIQQISGHPQGLGKYFNY